MMTGRFEIDPWDRILDIVVFIRLNCLIPWVSFYLGFI